MGVSGLPTSATVRAPRSRAKRSAASVSSVWPEYEATNTTASGPSRLGARQIRSYESETSDGTGTNRSHRSLPDHMLAHEPPLPTK